MQNNSFYVITGGPGVGKTTLIEGLAKQNYRCIPEEARKIIREQVQVGGQALPWADTKRYTQLMLDRSINTYRNEAARGDTVKTFFDRGILDTLCYARLIDAKITGEMELAAQKYRYNSRVFLLLPWKEIYQIDKERKQDWNEAVRTYELMADTYRQYDYEVREGPRGPIVKRVNFVMQYLL